MPTLKRKKNAAKAPEFLAPGYVLDKPLLNGSLSNIFEKPFEDVDRYESRIREAIAAREAAEETHRQASAAAAEANEEADRVAVLAEFDEASAKDVKKARAAADEAAAAVADAEDVLRIKRKAVAVLQGIRDTAKRKAQASAQADVEALRAEKVAAMAEAYRGLILANCELREVEMEMHRRGMLHINAALSDNAFMPRWDSRYLRGGKGTGVVHGPPASKWFDHARHFGFDV